MRVVFMGTPDFAVPSLKALKLAGYTVPAVGTQPDRPKGRGKKNSSPPVKECALELGLPVWQPEQARGEEFLERLREYAPEALAVVAYGQILPTPVLSLPKYGCINVHASLLPYYRGAAPIHRAVLNGERRTGVTTMYLDEGLDTGDLILKAEVSIGPADTTGDLHDRLAAAGAGLLVETLELVAQGLAPRAPQSGPSSYAPKLTAQDELICWSKPAEELYNQIRGLHPWPVARTYLGEKVVKVWRAVAEPTGNGQLTPGMVLETRRDGLLVNTGQGALLITELQLQGGKRLSAADFLRGQGDLVGRHFTENPTPGKGSLRP